MKRKASLIYILSFLIPVLIILNKLFLFKIFPFGNQSFLYWDSEFQYLNFYSYLKSTFFTNNNLLYSFSNLGGNSMFDFSAYYNFFSPFNLIFFFFPDKYLNIALELLMLIKIGLCGVSFAYFLNKEVKESYLSIIISASYALSMHTLITTMSNFIYMDGIIFFPLIAAGVSKIAEKNDSKLYLIATFMNILTNAYMGYVGILFSFIYFLYKTLLKKKDEFKIYFSNIKTLLFSTAISVGLCACFLIPVKCSISEGKYSYFNFSERIFDIRVGLVDILSKFYTNNLVTEFWQEHAPYVFVGILIIILFLLYFFNCKYGVKERIIDGFVSIFLFFGFTFNLLFIIWSMGVESPNGTMYRFTHVFILFILYITYKELVQIKNTKLKDVLAVFLIYLSITYLVFSVLIKDYMSIETVKLIVDSLYVTIILFLISISLIKNKYVKNISIIFIAILHFINLGIHTRFVFESQRVCCVSQNINTFINHKELMQKALNAIYKTDNKFYRIASEETFIERKDRAIYNNNPFLNSYDSIAGYSSFGKVSTRNFYYNIGVPVYMENMLFHYCDNMQTLPLSLLNVKYIISSNTKLHSPYEKIKNIDNKLYVYKNPYSFPFAFLVEDNNKLHENFYEKYKNIPSFQNNIVKALSNNDYGNIYNYKEIHSLYEMLQKLRENKKNNALEITFSEKPNYKNNTFFLTYSKDNMRWHADKIVVKNKNSNVEHVISDLNTQILFLGNNNDKFDISIYGIVPFYIREELGKLENIKAFILEENEYILEKYYKQANANKCDIKKISSSHLKGKFSSQDDKLLFMTIPYDEGWHIKINGKKRKAIKLFDAMMAIPVYKGENELEMKYIPKGFCLGIFISIISLIILTGNFLAFNLKNIYDKIFS